MARAARAPRPASFKAWRDGFRSRAIAAGNQPAGLRRGLRGVGVNAEVVRLDGKQAEFTKPIWEYLDSAASPTRSRPAARKRAPARPTPRRHRGPLRRRPAGGAGDLGDGDRTSASNRGSMPGDREPRDARLRGPPPRLRRGAADRRAAHPAVGRRRSRAHGRLLGRARWATPSSSRPRTSPMPSTSTATAGATSGRTTRPTRSPRPPTTSRGPAGSRPALGRRGAAARGLQLRQGRPVERAAGADWRARGVTLVNGAPLPDHGPAAIIAPAGARGPAFAVYHNFFVIKKYNNATSYAMGVGHLGDRIWAAGPSSARGRAASASSRGPRRSSCRSG